MKYFFGFLSILIFLSLTQNVYAVVSPQGDAAIVSPPGKSAIVSPPGNSLVKIENPIKAESIIELFQTLIDIVLIFAIPIIVFFIIYAGFLYVTARGNTGTIETAHKALLYALIGGLLILGARVLIEVIQGTVDSIIK